MLPLLCAIAFQNQGSVERDEYGVPHIKAPSIEQALYLAGYETARDRLWQMEQSRRLARGRMAEVFGDRYVASDTEVLKTLYTDAELQRQFDGLTPRVKQGITAYARGVSAYMKAGPLPAGYEQNAFKPDPWSPLDTVAITVRLFQQFGKGGAGEIRNMALIAYLEGFRGTKDKVLDVMDDFAWQNDPSATCTIAPADDPLAKPHPAFPTFDRAISQRHFAMIPKLSLFELLPGIRLSSGEESKRIAEQVSAPFKWGSYAVVVGPKRSTTGASLLLSAPQMGHRQPSVLHEMSIEAPGLAVVGVDVPGVPGVIIGKTKSLAWGLTSGVADTDDIFFSHADGEDGYTYGPSHLKLDRIQRTLHVKGEADRTVTQTRTRFGPVVIANKSWVFSRRSSYWMREMRSAESIFNLYGAKTPAEIDKAVQVSTMSFNFFWATPKDTGYRYCGQIPMRAGGLDPRLPTPGEPQYEWKGFIPQAQMPHVINPKSGLLANWNNKPVSWWPNLDTPVWGRIFRNTAVLEALQKPKLSLADVAAVPEAIARDEFTWPYFKPLVDAAFKQGYGYTGGDPDAFKKLGAIREALAAFDGRLVDGSRGAAAYQAFLDGLQDALILPTTGNFTSMDLFRQAAQPTLLWNALYGRSKIDYRGGRTPVAVAGEALWKAANALAAKFGTADGANWRYAAPSIKWGDEPPVPYSNRGTMIQVIDLRTMAGRNIVPPGVAESGPHAFDQVPLARTWTLKKMHP